MRRYLLILVLALVPVACAPKNVPVTTAGKVAYTADQVVVRLGELQKTVIDAALNGGMPIADARRIVTWISGDTQANPPVVGIAAIVGSASAGWQAAVRAGWPDIRPLIARNPKVAPFLPVVDAMIGGL